MLTKSVVFAAVIALVTVPAIAAQKTIIKLHQDPPSLTSIDLGRAGASHGDMLAFQAALRGADDLTATLTGLVVTVHMVGGEGENIADVRLGQLYVDFGDGNSIIVAGQSVYKSGSAEMEPNTPQVRAIIGGTGNYMAARGQVTTNRNVDGSYEHSVELLQDE
jgi:Ca2+-binding RTX toxin-like protein